MEAFTADWLALREPADARARSAKLTALVADRLQPSGPLRVLDLAAGTGANARYLAEFLAGRNTQDRPQWLLVDHDSRLLKRAASRLSASLQVETSIVDLASAFDPEGENICAGCGLVTASALLDLVSEGWLRKLAGKCRDAGAVVLFALTYNGNMRCLPEEAEDGEVRDLVNRHQLGEKGFGQALGPDAAESAARAFAAAGYEVRRESSDWVLAEDDRKLQAQLIEGWAEAAAAIAPDRADSIESWKARRLAHVAAGQSRLIVGHEDIAGWL
jgi:SAM-dependent methyltransferase